MKKFMLILLAIVINLVFAIASFAENFYIKNYDVYLDVKKNRDVIVTEKIDTYFTNSSHGIFRTIPISGKLVYENGKQSSFNARISDIDVNNKYSISKNNRNGVSNVVIKIGDKNKYINGFNSYTIKYKYSMGNDKIQNNDEFYFNIIGNDWNTNINKVRFHIKLPKEYSDVYKNTGFSLGYKGVRGYNPHHLNFQIENNKVIVGEVNRMLNPREGLTIRTTFPENYFEKSLQISEREITILVITLLTLIPFFMWFVYGRDEKVIPVVNFYPPKNKNSAEVDVEFLGSASHKGLVSLILYLASKGYLEIEDDEISFTLHKIKEYDGKNPFEKKMMSALFHNRDSVTAEELETSSVFYKSCLSIISALNKIKYHIFDQNSNSFQKIIILVVCIIGILISILYCAGDYTFNLIFSENAMLLLFPIIGTLVVSAVIVGMFNSPTPVSAKISTGIFITIWGAGFIGFPSLFILSQTPMSNYPIILYGVLGVIISIVCLINMPKRNRQGRLALGHLMGFKQFLEVAERHRLEMLIQEDPNYISEMLPFAYVLGVSDKIMPVIESLDLYNPPTWYRGRLNNDSFKRLSNTMLTSVSPSVANGGISRSSGSSGGSGFSGGGSSGGGGGGGGGGSW